MKKSITLYLTLLSISLTTFAEGKQAGTFTKADCPIPVPQELINSGKFMYGYMAVPEFHANPDGKLIELAVAIFKCQGEAATHSPLILNTGGPGLSNMDNFIPTILGGLGNLYLNNRDLVIIELRGLKYSKPNLFCPEIDELQVELAQQNFSIEKTIDRYMDTLSVTYDRFKNEGINLSAYNSLEIANDIAFVMEQFDYDTFSAFGSSFGTLVAQHLLLNHSDHLDSVVMNATVEMNKALYGMHKNSVDALESIFKQCEQNPEYHEAFPDLKNRFLNLLEELNQKPVILSAKNPKDGKTYDIAINGNKLSVWLFGDMYYNTQIPITLHKFVSGDFSEIQKRPGIIFPIPDFSNGLSLSIFLSEYPNIKAEHIPLQNEYANYVKGCGTMIFTPYFLNQDKNVWKVDKLSGKEKVIRSQVPTLMLNGELDHVCPPEYPTALAERLDNAYVCIFPGVAHSPIDAGNCGIMLMKEFIDNPSKAPANPCMGEFRHEFKIPNH